MALTSRLMWYLYIIIFQSRNLEKVRDIKREREIAEWRMRRLVPDVRQFWHNEISKINLKNNRKWSSAVYRNEKWEKSL